MTIAELCRLGFRANPLPPFYAHCDTCGRARWFGWFIGGARYRLDVTVCRTCQRVPAREWDQIAHAVAHRQVADMAETLDPETREVLVLKGMI